MILEVFPSPGPDQAPASGSGMGALGRSCVRYQTSGTASQPLSVSLTPKDLPEIEDLLGCEILPGQMIEWCTFPVFDAAAANIADGFRAAGTAIDLLFDDGSSLSESTPLDLTGLSTDPGARQDIDSPDQWNHRRVPLSAVVGKTVTAVIAVLAAGEPHGEVAAQLHGWIEAPRIAPIPIVKSSDKVSFKAEQVLTTRGTHSSPSRSRGNTIPAVGVPHGGIILTPATSLENTHWNYSWNAHSSGSKGQTGPTLAGMLISRSPSIWIGDRGALAIRVGETLDDSGLPHSEPFDHAQELAQPHLYRVTTKSQISIAGSSGNSSAVLEINFPEAGWIALTGLGGSTFMAMVDSHTGSESSFTHTTELQWDISTVCPSPHEAHPLTGFYSVAIESTSEGEPVELVPSLSFTADRILLRVTKTGRVRLRLGASLLSTDQARQAREREIGAASVLEIAAQNAAAWEPLLSLVHAPTSSADQQIALASDLYRLYLYPSRHDEDTHVGSQYFSPYSRELASGAMFTNNGFWDTYRTSWPAYALLSPHRSGELLDGMLEHVRASGWSPRWTAGTALDAMVGTSLDVIAADMVSSGINNFDLPTAYAAALRNSSTVSERPEFGRKGMPAAQFSGFVSADQHESVSWTLEGAICDAGTAVLAGAMSSQTEARWLASRALDYRTLFDTHTRFFRPRVHGPNPHSSTAIWADEPFDPRVWGGAHTETNAWGSRFGAAHDGPGLQLQFGGPAGLRAALDEYFLEPETARTEFSGSYGQVIHEMPEARDIRRGMWALSNQPAHHVAWLYAWTDEPWHTQRILKDAVDRLFLGMHIGQGFPGDEDNGEMSAWRLFATIGLAPFQPGSGELLLTAPRLAEILLAPQGRPPIQITASRQQESDCYIQRVLVDGVEWTKPTISVQRLHQGAHLSFELGDQPAQWSEPLPVTPFFAPSDSQAGRLEDRAVQVTSSDGTDLSTLVDNVGAQHIKIHTGSQWTITLTEPLSQPVSALLTLSLKDAGIYGFSVTTGVSGTGIESKGETACHFRDETWAWPSQTRPFSIHLPKGHDQVTLTWHGRSAGVSQVQVLTPSAALSNQL